MCRGGCEKLRYRLCRLCARRPVRITEVIIVPGSMYVEVHDVESVSIWLLYFIDAHVLWCVEECAQRITDERIMWLLLCDAR